MSPLTIEARRAPSAILTIICVLILTSACERSAVPPVDVGVQIEVAPQPPRVGASQIAIRLLDSSGMPITGAQIGIERIMTHPGMGPSFSDARETGSGRYHAALEFTMAGDWILLLHIRLPDGRKTEYQFAVRGVRRSE
jgi:hypothetical protein